MIMVNWMLAIFGPGLVFALGRLFEKIEYLKKVFLIFTILSISGFLICGIYDIYFKSSIINEILFSAAYLSLTTLLGLSFHIKNTFLKISIVTSTLLPVILCFILGISGFFGMAYDHLFSSKFEYEIRHTVPGGYLVQIGKLGDALEPDGIRIQVFKDIGIAPLMKSLGTHEDYGFYGDLESMSVEINNDTIELVLQNDHGQETFTKEILITREGVLYK